MNISLKPLYHKSKENIAICYPHTNAINNVVKKIKDVKWSQTNKCWYLPLSEASYKAINDALKSIAEIDNSLLKQYLKKKKQVQKTAIVPEASNKNVSNKIVSPKGAFLTKSKAASPAWQLGKENGIALQKFVEQLKLKAYSTSTIKTYRNEFLQLLQLLKKKPVYDLTVDDLRRYFVYCHEKLALRENTVHSRLNAVKFYFEQVLKREKFFWEIPRPKKAMLLPRFFNQDEICAIIKAAGNLKHKTMLMLAYSSGLRVSEVVSIKSRHIDSKRMCILIAQAKGKKDRMVALSAVLLIMLREYWKKYQPAKDGYLFEGQAKGEPYSSRSMQLVLAAAKKKAGILKPGSMHALRHSFATHLLDKGTDVTDVTQKYSQ